MLVTETKRSISIWEDEDGGRKEEQEQQQEQEQEQEQQPTTTPKFAKHSNGFCIKGCLCGLKNQGRYWQVYL